MTIKQKTIGVGDGDDTDGIILYYYVCTQVPNTQRDIVLCDYLYYSIIIFYVYILLRDRVSG